MADFYRCPMPTIRFVDDDRETTGLEVCGETLVVRFTGINDVGDEVPGAPVSVYSDETDWRLECHAGHVLALPDTEDNYPALLHDQLRAILEGLGAVGEPYDFQRAYPEPLGAWPKP